MPIHCQVIGTGFVYLQKNKPPITEILEKADELKIIVHNKHDLTFAKQNAKYVERDCILFLQPEWSVKKGYAIDL